MATGKAQNYNLEYLSRGSSYSGISDYRRFVTLDYNFKSYVGILGNGVISGWEVVPTSGLNLQILPGRGIIDGFAVQSPYLASRSPYSVRLQRSGMLSGEREIEELHDICNSDGTVVTYPILTPLQRAAYVAIVRAYDPSFDTPSIGDIENVPITVCNVASSSTISIPDNSERYIYAVRANTGPSFPPANDFPTFNVVAPKLSDYTNYANYVADSTTYKAGVADIHNYEWRNNPANHFDEVDFVTSSSFLNSIDKILLARVVSKDGSIIKVDTSQVQELYRLSSSITSLTKELLSEHKHGGSLAFDPPRVNLTTDIRSTALKTYFPASLQSVFYVLEKERTSVSLGHNHNFYMDSSGSGLTMEKFGSGENHFHKIANGIVGVAEASVNNVASHIHTLPIAEQLCCWTADSEFEVIANGKVFGDNTSSSISADSDKKLLILNGAVGATYNKYTMSIPLNIPERNYVVNGTTFTSPAIVTTFTFTQNDYSVLSFMLKAMNAFHAQFSDQIYSALNDAIAASASGNIEPVLFNAVYAEDPFTFISSSETNTVQSQIPNSQGAGNANITVTTTISTPQIVGIEALMQQCAVAQVQLKNSGDSFVFTPNAARNVMVTLLETSTNNVLYDVKLEILSNTEVTGKLNPENIAFINAEKFKIGEFQIERIPFISHIGRMGENASPFQYPLISNNGIQYAVTPAITSTVFGHHHRLNLNVTGDGVTIQTMMGTEPIYYADGKNGNQFLIDHIHPVNSGNVVSVNSTGIVAWQNDLYGSNISTAAHTHTVVNPLIGSPKLIYAIAESDAGDIYLGTSAGLMLMPTEAAYLLVVNGYAFYLLGNDLWTVLNAVKPLYEKEVATRTLVVNWDIYGSQVTEAETLLDSPGTTFLLLGYKDPTYGQDKIMVERVDSFEIPNFKAYYDRKTFAVKPGETVIGRTVIDLTTGNEITAAEAATLLPEQVEILLRTEKDLSFTPVWSLITSLENGKAEITAAGGDLFARSANVVSNLYGTWVTPDMPTGIGTIKKVFMDSQHNYWVATSNGLYVSRTGYQGTVLDYVNQAGLSANINDIAEATAGSILIACDDGVYKTVNGGASWTVMQETTVGFSQVFRDYKLDKTNVVTGHYHTYEVNALGNGSLSASIGSGVSHTHSVTAWAIGTTLSHTHVLQSTMYGIEKNGNIYISFDNGTLWAAIATALPTGEKGVCYAFGGLLLSKVDGLYLLSGQDWNKILDKTVYSFAMGYAFDKLFLGCYNALYTTVDLTNFTLLKAFNGYPSPVIFRDEAETVFGYAYSNKNNSFYTKEPIYDSTPTWALIDFSEWLVARGSWKETFPYDVYVNSYLVLSTKQNLDKREKYGYDFVVSPTEGLLNFGAQGNLLHSANVYASSLSVSNAANFNVGDFVLIKSEASAGLTPDMTFFTSLDSSYYASLQTYLVYLERKQALENMYFYGNVAAVSANQVFLTEPLDKDIELPATVTRIPNINGDTPIKLNIYESPLAKAGTFTHEELEDKLSAVSDGKPYTLNNSFLSGLLQLTQAVREFYPDINSAFKDTEFYDFKYSWNSGDANYIGNFVDLFSSDINNSNIFTTNFVNHGSSVVNKILFGEGQFANNVLVGTDLGIFWAKIEDGLAGNWFYANNIRAHVYDIAIFDKALVACTSEGTFVSTDMDIWTPQVNTPADFVSTQASLRWVGAETVFVSNHTAILTSGYRGDANVGVITTDGLLYGQLLTNHKINIEIATASPSNAVSGVYTIKTIGDNEICVANHAAVLTSVSNVGQMICTDSRYEFVTPNRQVDITVAPDSPNNSVSGIYTIATVPDANTITTVEDFPVFGSEIEYVTLRLLANSNSLVTYESFDLPANSVSEYVSIRMGAWWEYLNDSVSSENPAVTNTLLIGGYNNIAYCNNAYGLVWSQAAFPAGVNNFQISDFCPTDTGLVFASAVSTSKSSPTNYVFKCSGDGSDWKTLMALNQITGTIQAHSLTSFSHTKLSVKYAESNAIYSNGNVSQNTISVFKGAALVYVGNILYNEKTDKDYIYVFSNELSDLLSMSSGNFSFVVTPIKVNCLLETKDNSLLYGTDYGLYSDKGGILRSAGVTGAITDVGINGLVSKIDMVGTIKSVSASNRGFAQLSISTDDSFFRNDLVSRKLFVLTSTVSSQYTILSNSGKLVTGEATIELDVFYSDALQSLIGQQASIQGKDSSRIYFNSNRPMAVAQFNGGKMYIVSNENSNKGTYRSVVSSGIGYVEVTPAIVPALAYALIKPEKELLVGQKICLTDKNDRLTIYVNFDTDVYENDVADGVLNFSGDSIAGLIQGMTAYSNERNSILLNPFALTSRIAAIPLAFAVGDSFKVACSIMQAVANFNNRITTIVEDHHHHINTVSATISGEIASFANVNSAYVDLEVSNTVGFTSSMVQFRGDLFTDATIYFFNPQDTSYWFTSQVVSHNASEIRVRIKNASNWDFVTYQQQAISTGWAWEINANNYGYTESTYYDDFVLAKISTTDNVLSGQNAVSLTSTSGLLAGQKVIVKDETLKEEENIVANVFTSTVVDLVYKVKNNYYARNNPVLEVVSNVFANNHVHQIRNNQLENVYITAYLDHGYNSTHAHAPVAFLPHVSKLDGKGEEILAVGSSENIFVSYNNGSIWATMANINDYIEYEDKASSILEIELDANNKWIVGTDKGYILTEEDKAESVPLEKPILE